MSILDGAYWEEEMRKKTNYDKIINKNKEDLARWLTTIEVKILQTQPKLEPAKIYEDWLEWLNQEIDNG